MKKSIFEDLDLSIEESSIDEDGEVKQKSSLKSAEKHFIRKVEVGSYNTADKKQLIPIPGSIKGVLTEYNVNEHGKPSDTLHVQKCEFSIYIDPMWQLEARSGDFKIHPVIFQEGLENGEVELEDCQLNVSIIDATYNKKAYVGNSPVVVSTEPTLLESKDGRKRINFTFGLFIDGTRNSLYNTEARQAFEQRTGRIAHNQKELESIDKNEKKYRYEVENSYDNDLSNPAIIFQNYNEDKSNNKNNNKKKESEIDALYRKSNKKYKIYTEGISTLTEPDAEGNLGTEQYKDDDLLGYAFGVNSINANAGILQKVRKTIKAMVDQITIALDGDLETIGNLTIDVFGFSRGAAAARHLVHEIKHRAYAIQVIDRKPYDRHGYQLAEKYLYEKLPDFGYLGILLAEKEKTFDHLEVRFAGLFDTVPHHGVSQDNDIDDLGLDSINQAKFVVHLVADDEHRKNFSLVDISGIIGKKGGGFNKKGVELYLPGVHCDVGGSYVEGRREVVNRIEQSYEYHELSGLKKELVKQGWYRKEDLRIYNQFGEINDSTFNKVQEGNTMYRYFLTGDRQHVSNQYSFIPLRIMVRFCLEKEVRVDEVNINDKYKFKELPLIGNGISFLTQIQERLESYAFHGGKKYFYDKLHLHDATEHILTPEEFTILMQKKKADWAVDVWLDKEFVPERSNDYLKFLRYHYLHWNSTYGHITLLDRVADPYEPNMEHDRRKRRVR